MIITRSYVAEQLGKYLRHEIDIDRLADWAAMEFSDGEFETEHQDVIGDVLARVGTAHVPQFALSWEDIEELLEKLGYSARVELSANGK